MANGYTKVPLYGGAIQAELPKNFIDASNIRQIPDNQEVFLDSDGFTSIVIEILEQVQASSDADAFKAHVLDLVGEEDAGHVDASTAGIKSFSGASGTPSKDTAVYTFDLAAPPGKNEQERLRTMSGQNHAADAKVTLLLALVRIPKKETDILISVNIPEAQSNTLAAADQARTKLLESFEIKDWTLFG